VVPVRRKGAIDGTGSGATGNRCADLRAGLPSILLAALLAAVLWGNAPAARAADDRGNFATYGSGELSCLRWLDDRGADNESARQSEMWVAGYLTAYNFYIYKDYDITDRFDGQRILQWIDEYCQDRPPNRLVVATHELVQMLRRRR
jgi:hypothetical protein